MKFLSVISNIRDELEKLHCVIGIYVKYFFFVNERGMAFPVAYSYFCRNQNPFSRNKIYIAVFTIIKSV